MEEVLVILYRGEDEATAISKKVGKSIEQVNKKADNAAKQGLKKFGGALGKGAKALTTFGLAAGTAVVAFAGFAIKAAADAEEIQNKFSVVFETVSDDAEKMAKELAKNYGLSNKAAKEMLAGTGDLLTGFGFTDAAALDLSSSVQELAVDLASFQNLEGGATRASELLTKGLLGEREGLKSLGVVIKETDISQRLLDKGMQDLTGNALLSAKAQATYELILEQTTKAQGDFERSSDSLTNQTRILQARFEDIQVEIGSRLLPIVNILVGLFLNEGIPAFKKLADKIVPVVQGIAQLALGIVDLIRYGDSMNDWLWEFTNTTGMTREQADMFYESLRIVREVFIQLLETLGINKDSMTEMITIMGGLALAIGVVTVTLGILTSPLVILIATLAAVAAATVALKNAWENDFMGIRTFTEETMTAINEFIDENFGEIFETIVTVGAAILKHITENWDLISKTIGDTVTVILVLLEGAFNMLINTVTNTFTLIKDIIEGNFNIIKGIVQIFIGIVTGDFDLMKQGIESVFSGIGQIIVAPFKFAESQISNIVGGIIGTIDNLLNKVDTLKNAVTSVGAELGFGGGISTEELVQTAVARGDVTAEKARLAGFANGGSFKVGGSGGTDSQVVAFRATPGETVDVRTPQQNINNNSKNIDMRGSTQIFESEKDFKRFENILLLNSAR
jgi:phage-related protein